MEPKKLSTLNNMEKWAFGEVCRQVELGGNHRTL